MAVNCIRIEETWPEGAGGSWDVQHRSDGTTEATRTFLVFYDDTGTPNERMQDSYTANDGSTSIPAKGSALIPTAVSGEDYYGVVVDEITSASTASLTLFIVTVRYTNQESEGDGGNTNVDPWDKNWEVSYPQIVKKKLQTETRVTTVGPLATTRLNTPSGTKVANAAGELYDPQPMEDAFPMAIRLTKYFQNTPAFRSAIPASLRLRGTMNSEDDIVVAQFTIPKHLGLMTSLTINPLYKVNTLYWGVSVDIAISDDYEWYLEMYNKGHYYVDAVTGKEIFPTDNSSRKTAQKRWLNAAGSGFEDNLTGSKFSLLFGTKREADWNNSGCLAIVNLPTTAEG
jgi:hypothetical protein